MSFIYTNLLKYSHLIKIHTKSIKFFTCTLFYKDSNKNDNQSLKEKIILRRENL